MAPAQFKPFAAQSRDQALVSMILANNIQPISCIMVDSFKHSICFWKFLKSKECLSLYATADVSTQDSSLERSHRILLRVQRKLSPAITALLEFDGRAHLILSKKLRRRRVRWARKKKKKNEQTAVRQRFKQLFGLLVIRKSQAEQPLGSTNRKYDVICASFILSRGLRAFISLRTTELSRRRPVSNLTKTPKRASHLGI